jgi:hypothetical protein
MNLVVAAFVQLTNILKEAINRLLGVTDFIAFLVGFQPFKKLRLRVVLLRDENGAEMVEREALSAAIAELTRVFARSARTHIVAAEPLILDLDGPAPVQALNVHCDDGAWQEDFGLAGAFFRGASARNTVGLLTGYAAPVTVFIVKEISGKGGCSLGPLTDYVTQEARTVRGNRLMAHEVAHACGLGHAKETSNLMYPKSPGSSLTRLQAAIFRNSRHVTYL